MGDRDLTDKELEGIINNMSDCEYESDVDDSVESTDSEFDAGTARKRKKLEICVEANANVGAIDTPVDSEVNLSESSESSSDECSPNRDVSGSHEVRVIWNDCSGNLKDHPFNANPGFSAEFFAKRSGDEPLDFYKLFLADIIPMIVQETNRYATQKIISCIANETIQKNSLLTHWKDTNESEIVAFIGMLIWMGLDKKPTLKDYFSRNILHKNDLGKYIGMSRMRFELLLSNLHFSDNETTDRTNRIYKIQPLADGLITNFQAACIPKKDVCIDETMIPFRGRLSFRQYIPGKRHKYGVKIFKLCAEKGYTYNLKVYSGKEDNPTSQSVASRVVLELMEPLLDCGRLLCTDNFYTSVSLAHELLDRKTHLIGTLRKNRKFNPKPITDAKLEKGDLIVRENNTHVIVGKWRDKREVLFLTTKAVPEMTDVQTKRGVVKKPSTIAKYNSIKSFIDVSDQKASYSTTVRRGIKWYRKVAIEILTNTAVVNAHIAYQFFTKKTINITKFREELVNKLFNERHNIIDIPSEGISRNHKIIEITSRGRCTRCYKANSERNGRAYAMANTPRIKMHCQGCEHKFLCMKCFFDTHNCSLRK
ncbi:unnamed protein product [Acanthoscelides obtectus]|uniref:PiggyBac transposable element-derived protein domain-containing protein n=1 Tax=Acanthoscelides obtectus TaxID=200917 RepID=A0A9P0PWI5_ACAOB|nr:unnamed protein product [Acanthoscelides obtectus]CAK1663577.1 PiggyBac transposable element-derived protein 4 [Acanthoscelides obtectus]